MNANLFRKIETITFLLITIWGVVQGQVTVFYIIYLFWAQELVRTVVNSIVLNRKEGNTAAVYHQMKGSFFLLFLYVIFIVVLFGIILNWDNLDLLKINLRILLLRNTYFNINMVLFGVQYYLYLRYNGLNHADIKAFNRSHLILHISIVIAGVIQMAVVKQYPAYFSGKELWGSALVVLPFLLLKIWLGRK
ncbi:hypothetical protein [Sediminibacterium ginsengisoli]|uniref:Uncharacterized protein n=1 Tax=Sediminibacterium ginsengisoli TaxID=413434 RepID=A0A1T4RX96_9BACT|nr:hypothetical protein [Sediminibacterium ginsengisoli]SKA20583.1 hypothetical protein SAMN04488132_11611 [Sediminibacterium ginsengisoli]